MASEPISIEPVVSYPRTARPGERHYLTVDLQHRHPPERWPYAQEELALTCLINTSLFTHEPLGDQSIVLHRFGGSYGPAAFLLTAKEPLQKGTITLHFVNRHGMTVHTVVLRDIEIAAKPAAVELPTLPVPIRAQAPEVSHEIQQQVVPEDVPDAGLIFEDTISKDLRKRIRKVVADFQEYLVRTGILEGGIAPLLVYGSTDNPEAVWFDIPGAGWIDRGGLGPLLMNGSLLLEDTLLHEYAHHVLLTESHVTTEELATVESGLADYLVCSYRNDPRFGVQEAEIPGYATPFRHLDNRVTFEQRRDSAIPALGEIWGAVFWELRQHFGAQVIDQLVTQAWRETEGDFPRALLRRMARRSFEKFEKTWEILLARGAVEEREHGQLLLEAVQPLELSLPPLSIDRKEAQVILDRLISAQHMPIMHVVGYYGQASATLLRLVGLHGERQNVPMQILLFDVPSRLPQELRPHGFLEFFVERINQVVQEARSKLPENMVIVGICNFHRFHAWRVPGDHPSPTPALEPQAILALQDTLTSRGDRLLLACRPDTPRTPQADEVRLGDLDEREVLSLRRMFGVRLSEEGGQELLLWTGGSLHLAEMALQGARQQEWSLEDLMRFESEAWFRIFDAEMARVRQWLREQSLEVTEVLEELGKGYSLALSHEHAPLLMGQGLIRRTQIDAYTLRTPLYKRVLYPNLIARLPREYRDRTRGRPWELGAWRLVATEKRGIRLVLRSYDEKRAPLPQSVSFLLTPEIQKTVRSTHGRAIADFFVSTSFGPITAYAELELEGEQYQVSLPLDDISSLPELDLPSPPEAPPESPHEGKIRRKKRR